MSAVDPFAPPPPDSYRQKTPDCRHVETDEERQDNRDRGIFGAADCHHDHVCSLYVNHYGRHRSKKCYHYFGIDDESPSVKLQALSDALTAEYLPEVVAGLSESERNELLKTFPPCDCGSVMVMPDGRIDDIGEHEEDCPYHLAALAAFGPLPTPLVHPDGPSQAIADEINRTGGITI